MTEQITIQTQDQNILIQDAEQDQTITITKAIKEIEKYYQYLNKRYSLNIRNDLIVLIHETRPTTLGFFRGVGCPKVWNKIADKDKDLVFKHQTQEQAIPINSITISSHLLRGDIYSIFETITHEFAHYLNLLNGYKGNKNNYHTKDFKIQCEKLLLSVSKGNYGYDITEVTPEFNQMIDSFRPDATAFKIFQNTDDKANKPKSRLLLFVCGCGYKIRCAKNQDRPLNAVCQYCNTEFKEQ